MGTPSLSRELMLEAKMALDQCGGNVMAAARKLGIPHSTMQNRLRRAQQAGIATEPTDKETDVLMLRDRVRELETELRGIRRENIDADNIRKVVMGLAEVNPSPPKWTLRKSVGKEGPGIPTLMLSDLHWGEVVDPSQVNGVNEYNLTIANQRLRTCVETAVDLLKKHTVNPKFPGIVVPLGGDMLSGDIHEELSATNETEIMPSFVNLFEAMIWALDALAGEFGHVFVPCVTGNHGRNTKKIRAKGRNFTSFDWLLYTMLEKHYAKDKRLSFYIPNGPDARYEIYGHGYLLTHGDQYRGGDGMIGPIGPIFRGDHKKRSRNAQIDLEYDTQIMGHFHTLMQLERLIVNGSLKGYDEYAFSGNFPYEPPRQALWLTHPQHGITISMPVYVDRKKPVRSNTVLAWPAAA